MKNTLKFLKHIWHIVPQKIIIEVVLCLYQAVADFLVGVYLYRILVSLITERSGYMHYISIVAIIFCICIVRGILQTGYNSYYKPLLALRLDEGLSRVIHKKQSVVLLSAYENPAFYDLMKRACDNIRPIPDKIMTNICNFVGFFVTALLTLLFVFSVDNVYLLFLAFPLIHSLSERRASVLKYRLNRASIPAERKRAYVMDTVFSKEAAKDIRTSDIYSAFFKMLKESESEIHRIRKRFGFKLAIASFISDLFGSYMPLVCSCFYTAYNFLIIQRLSLADCSVLIAAIILFYNRLSRIGNFANTIKANKPYIDDWFQFMEFPEERRNYGALCERFEKLTFIDASFSYTKETPVLSGVNIEIKRGEKICIVGMNGAGKSSFVKLMLGLYSLDSGELLYNDRPLTDYSLESYRNQFAVVFQDYQIYAASVEENVIMDVPTVGDEAYICSALESAGLGDKVKSFEDGIHSVLSKEFNSHGEILSGGESQKIAIARLYARKYEIAVLDEPSSSLDPLAEKDMYEKLLSATEGKTVIYISHNLSSARLSDRILLFQEGKIIEEGTHCELMALNGKYSEMFRLQAAGYVSGEESKDETQY